MSLLEQIEQNPLLLDSEDVRAQVRSFSELDYNKAWNLYIHAQAKRDSAKYGFRDRHPGPR